MRCDNCGWGNPDGAERCQKCNQVLPQVLQSVENDPLAEILAAVNKGKPVVSESVEESAEVQSSVCHKCGYPKLSASENCPNCGAIASVMKANDAAPVAQDQPAEQPVTPPVNDKALKATVVLGDAIEDVAASAAVAMPQQAVADAKKTVRDVNRVQGNMKATVRDFSPEAFVAQQSDNAGTGSRSEILKQTVKSGVCLVAVDGLADDVPQCVFCDAEDVTLNRANVEASNLSIDSDQQVRIAYEDGRWYIQDLSKLKNTYIRSDRKMQIERGDMIVIGNRRFILQ